MVPTRSGVTVGGCGSTSNGTAKVRNTFPLAKRQRQDPLFFSYRVECLAVALARTWGPGRSRRRSINVPGGPAKLCLWSLCPHFALGRPLGTDPCVSCHRSPLPAVELGPWPGPIDSKHTTRQPRVSLDLHAGQPAPLRKPLPRSMCQIPEGLVGSAPALTPQCCTYGKADAEFST
eukprot:scaffold5532_cov263-Pinguiococcus_pyrenoidosus.AAC.5